MQTHYIKSIGELLAGQNGDRRRNHSLCDMRSVIFLLAILSVSLISSCASYSGYSLKPGLSGLDDVERVMGKPAMRWQNPDNSLQLAYPRGPSGLHTYMVFIGQDGKLQRIENVLDEKVFARIHPGMTQEEVLRTLGPPGWTTDYPRRDELEWEWRFCNLWNQAARFDVLFDNANRAVRSTMSPPGDRLGFCMRRPCTCAH